MESTIRLGRHRWKVERSLAWLLANRRLTVRYERRADLLTAFLHLACALICARKLQPSCVNERPTPRSQSAGAVRRRPLDQVRQLPNGPFQALRLDGIGRRELNQ